MGNGGCVEWVDCQIVVKPLSVGWPLEGILEAAAHLCGAKAFASPTSVHVHHVDSYVKQMVSTFAVAWGRP